MRHDKLMNKRSIQRLKRQICKTWQAKKCNPKKYFDKDKSYCI